MKITKSQLKEMIKQALSELKEGGPGSGRPTKPGSKRHMEKGMDKAVADANAKLDAAEKAMKKKKKNEGGPGSGRKGGFDVGGPAYPNVPKGAKSTKQARKMLKKKKKVKESKNIRTTVKEVKMWMKTLEENRYKKTYNSDARRVAWMVNNEGVELSEMPISMKKKWTKAQYGREKYLAKEFIKSKKARVNEMVLRKKIREIIVNNGG